MLLTALLLACAPPPLDSAPVDTSPSIVITWPLPETEVESCAMVVAEIHNFSLMDASAMPPNEDGVGHFHVEFEGSYALCYKPYCLVDLSTVTTATPTLTAVLVGNDHQPLLDENGDRYQDTVPLNLKQGECKEGTPSQYP